jgi:hypothetical protein
MPLVVGSESGACACTADLCGALGLMSTLLALLVVVLVPLSARLMLALVLVAVAAVVLYVFVLICVCACVRVCVSVCPRVRVGARCLVNVTCCVHVCVRASAQPSPRWCFSVVTPAPTKVVAPCVWQAPFQSQSVSWFNWKHCS